MNKMRYTDIDMSVVHHVMDELTRLKRFPVLLVHKSDHPDDAHLYLVMGEHQRGDTVTYDVWTYNDSSHSMNGGAYDMTLAAALKNMSERIQECQGTFSS